MQVAGWDSLAWLDDAHDPILPMSRGDAQTPVRSPIPADARAWVGSSSPVTLNSTAAGVAWEFEPNASATARLEQISIKRFRCIGHRRHTVGLSLGKTRPGTVRRERRSRAEIN